MPQASTQPVSGASVIAQANATCAQRNRELKAATVPGASLSQIAASAPRRAAIERAALSKLVRLTPPSALAGEWRTVVLETAAVLRRTMALERLAGAGGSANALREQALLNKPQLRLLVAATRAGVRECTAVAGPSVRPF